MAELSRLADSVMACAHMDANICIHVYPSVRVNAVLSNQNTELRP